MCARSWCAQLQETRQHMDQLMQDAIQVAQKVFDAKPDEQVEYVIAGETNLMGFAELSNVDRLRRLFEAFNEKHDILRLLDSCLRAEGIQIFIGQESGYRILDDISVVTAPYTARQPGGRGARHHRPHADGLRAGHPDRRRHGKTLGFGLERTQIAPKLAASSGRLTRHSFEGLRVNEINQSDGRGCRCSTTLPAPRHRRRLAAAEAKAQENWNSYLRAVAELENFRKRMEREIDNARKFAIERFAQELVSGGRRPGGGHQCRDRRTRVRRCWRAPRRPCGELQRAFDKAGIKIIDPKGQPFDPELARGHGGAGKRRSAAEHGAGGDSEGLFPERPAAAPRAGHRQQGGRGRQLKLA